MCQILTPSGYPFSLWLAIFVMSYLWWFRHIITLATHLYKFNAKYTIQFGSSVLKAMYIDTFVLNMNNASRNQEQFNQLNKYISFIYMHSFCTFSADLLNLNHITIIQSMSYSRYPSVQKFCGFPEFISWKNPTSDNNMQKITFLKQKKSKFIVYYTLYISVQTTQTFQGDWKLQK